MPYKVHFNKTAFRNGRKGNSLVVQWLGLRVFTAEGLGSVPVRGIKIPQGAGHSPKKKKKGRKNGTLTHDLLTQIGTRIPWGSPACVPRAWQSHLPVAGSSLPFPGTDSSWCLDQKRQISPVGPARCSCSTAFTCSPRRAKIITAKASDLLWKLPSTKSFNFNSSSFKL